MKQFLLLLTVLLGSNALIAQTNVGYRFDSNGMPLNGHVDPFTYQPKSAVRIVHNSDSYETGYYIDNEGKKVEGLIKFQNKKIFFKSGETEYADKIRPDLVKSIKIGTDSFFVARKLYYKDRLRDGPEFIQFVAEVEGTVFAKYYFFKEFTMSGTSPLIITYLAKKPNSDVWESLTGSDAEFSAKVGVFFGHLPHVVYGLSKNSYKESDVLSLIMKAKNYQHYLTKTPILYNQYWREILAESDAKYKAQITNIQDSIWTFEYFDQKRKLYEINYSSFAPNKKEGMFRAFNDRGDVVREIEYVKDKPKLVTMYNTNGSILYQYTIKKVTSGYDESIAVVSYLMVNDNDGNSLPFTTPNFIEKREDAVVDRVLTLTYSNGKLQSSSFEQDNQTLYQVTDPNNSFSIKKMQLKVDNYLDYESYQEALTADVQGLILVSFVLDEKGYVTSYQILNSLHPELDRALLSHIEEFYVASALYRVKLKPIRNNSKKVSGEVVVPFEFSINRFYRAINYNNGFMMQQMMWQQQQFIMQPQIHVPVRF